MPDVHRITSRQHPFVKRCRSLAVRRDADHVVLDGAHLVIEAVAARVPIDGLLTDGRQPTIVSQAAAAGTAIYEAPADVVAAASPVRSASGIVAIARWRPAPLRSLVTGSPLLVGLVDVQDPGNVGSVVRSADALGADGVLALGATADPGGWKALRAAMGSTFRLPVARDTPEAALELASRNGMRVVAGVPTGGEPIGQSDAAGAWLLLVGNEGAGLPDALVARADRRVSIPMRRGVESLNVSVSTAILIWEATRARRSAAPSLP